MAIAAAVGGLVASASGAITTTGDVLPDPTTTTSSNSLYVGYFADGTMTVNLGSDVNSAAGTLGNNPGVNGEVTVDGVGSTWTNSGNLSVGYEGTGELNIEAGGAVTNTNGFLGRLAGGQGTASVDGTGSTWTNSGYLYVGNQGHGTLNVTNGGHVSSSHGTIGWDGGMGEVTVDGAGSTWTNSVSVTVGDGTLSITNGGHVSSTYGSLGTFGSSATGRITVDGVGSTWTSTGHIKIGEFSAGALDITNGGKVVSTGGSTSIGSSTGSNGVVTVAGVGSTWNHNGGLSVGESGAGTLNITSGGKVISGGTNIGYTSGSVGVVTVEGSGSTWSTGEYLSVGGPFSGAPGTLTVRDGGRVNVLAEGQGNVKIYSGGTINLQAGGTIHANSFEPRAGSTFNFTGGTLRINGHFYDDLIVPVAGMVVFPTGGLINGDVTNSGKIVFTVSPYITEGAYSPIIPIDGVWTDTATGVVQVIGGSWDAVNHQIVVTEPTVVSANTQTAIDTASTPRVQVNDGSTTVTVAFQADQGSLNFQASINPVTQIAQQNVAAAWDFEADGAAIQTTMVSMNIGEGYDPDLLTVWHSTNGGVSWTLHTTDITYEDGVASFLVEGFSSYAIAPVPEPASATLLMVGAGLLIRRRAGS
mgnify:CR=1 FL=1